MARFADQLQRLLKEQGVSQYRLAQLSGITKQTLSRLVLGQQDPSWETVQRLAAALGVSCEQFTDPGLKEPPAAPKQRPRGRPKKVAAMPAPPAEELEEVASQRRKKRAPSSRQTRHRSSTSKT
jgi:transcriptional regulator with XRE-family HTH domain